MKELKRVLIMAGGTGGHVFPGLAVARYLRANGVAVDWLGTSAGLEATVVPEAGFPLHVIRISGLRGKGLKAFLLAPFKMLGALWESTRVIKAINPDVVIGMGGFASGPGGLASWIARRPLLIHEQNAKPGYTNKLLAHLAKKVLTGFPDAFPPGKDTLVIGNPVRAEIENLPTPAARFSHPRSPLRLLVLGGSLGAQALNDAVPAALAQLAENERPNVLHQTGIKHYDQAKKNYESMGIEADLKPFVNDMAAAYSWADMVICRAGALTVAELCSAGLGAVFIPFPHAVDDHQTANAQFMVEHRAAICVQQSELTESGLAAIVREFSLAPEKRVAMAEAAYLLRKEKVAEKVYQICQEVCR